ncbi:hypothetical protein PILCRDRAFT_81683 [Piloderma croceum F 1598]|uniref:Uncharacterized protein n=1 Tax=Piloderma croceum (strain F 1598) TaxID=765440 RepID=A0A0C3AFV7_PILCF|nr:hypothetical protein PILCRDRAFT_81683 [Piloderma croceum F 1598]
MLSTQSRPHLSRSFSEYTAMLLALDDISQANHIFIKVFVWILLAGFLVLPATFAKLQQTTGTNSVELDVISHLGHVHLFIFRCVCSGIGVLGMCWFWYRWHANYVWICSNIFLNVPGALNALQGVIATLSSNYGQNNKLQFVGSSKWTLIATGGLTVSCAVLYLFYNFIMLQNVRKQHDVEHGEQQAGAHGEGTGFENRRHS